MPPTRKVARNNKKKGGAAAEATKEKKAARKADRQQAETNEPLPTFHDPASHKKSNNNEQDFLGGHYQQYKKATQAVWDGIRSLVPQDFNLKSVNDLARASNYILDASLELSWWAADASSGGGNASDSSDTESIYLILDNMNENDQAIFVQKLHGILIPSHLLVNLEASIKLRTLVMDKYTFVGKDDGGHTHLIKILKYCSKVLRACRRKTRIFRKLYQKIKWRKIKNRASCTTNSENGGEDDGTASDVHVDSNSIPDPLANRFAAFMDLQNNDGDDDDDEQDGMEAETEEEKQELVDIINKRKEGIETAPVDKDTDIYTIADDLIKGDDRMQACAFLHTMEELMALIAAHYRMLKRNVRTQDCSDPQMLMECAMVANTCMHSVQRVEASLALDYPHLSSFYNVLAVVFLPLAIEQIDRIIPSAAKEKYDRTKVIEFVGSIVETCFHNKGVLERYHKLVRDFSRKTGAPLGDVEKWSKVAKTLTDLEIQSATEANHEQNRWVRELMRQEGGRVSHQWLSKDHPYIGGKRNLLNTQRWLQTIAHISDNETKLIPTGGFFGQMWDESHNLASSFQGDLDELFCGSILPELFEWCKTRNVGGGTLLLDAISPYTPETLPILDMLKKFLKKKNTPAPASLAFGMHAILTSVIELQGDGDVARHAENTEQSWNTMFDQLAQQVNTDNPTPNHDSFFINVKRFGKLRVLPSPVGEHCSSRSARHAFFNPLMAGSYLLFANYVMSIGLGSCTADSIGQLRYVLHLYNAFKQSDLVEDLPLVNEVDGVFKNTKAVWVFDGDHPIQGEFCKRFLLAWGYAPKAAMKLMKAMEKSGAKGMKSSSPQNDCRNLIPILPEEFSLSYRLIMMRDFTGIVDDYSVKNYEMYTPEQKKQNDTYLKTLSNINMTRDAMDNDEDFVCFTNWTQVGCIFNDFIRQLMVELGWDRIVQQQIRNVPDNVRRGVRVDGSRVKRDFQLSDVNLEYQAYSHFISQGILFDMDKTSDSNIARKAAAFMKKYFSSINKESYSFFIDNAKKKRHASSASTETTNSQPAIPAILESMSVKELKHVASTHAIDIRGCVEKKDIIGLLSSILGVDSCIRGTKVKKASPMVPDPIDISLEYPRERNGTYANPYHAYILFKESKNGEAKARIIKPGKLTPIADDYPYERRTPQLVPVAHGNYRHVASFTLKELRQLGWDGAMYNSQSVGTWVPFIDGYDSDPDDAYETFDRRKAHRSGVIGLPLDDINKVMYSMPEKSGLVVLKK